MPSLIIIEFKLLIQIRIKRILNPNYPIDKWC